MINVTTLYGNGASAGDALRYGEGAGAAPAAAARRPVVVWTMTRQCNLHCRHCYTDSANRTYPGELSVAEAGRLLEDLAAFEVPALLLSGDEPLGNVRERPFSAIWTDPSQPLLAALRDRLSRLTGRCSRCRWKVLCGGGFRARARRATGDPWTPDPACYLSDEEIA